MWLGGQAARLDGLRAEYQRRLGAIQSASETLTEEELAARIEELDEWYDTAVRGASYCLYGRAPVAFPWKVI